jgi:hypothetical protein
VKTPELISAAVFLTEIMQHGDQCPGCEGKVHVVQAHWTFTRPNSPIVRAGRVLVLSGVRRGPEQSGCLHVPIAYRHPLVIAWMAELMKDCIQCQ